ncbi:16S rRNA (guanine(966)-N(2))-methyltransferase RsmD [Zunongwangia sp. F363]|uniref:16S rRNA (Guanine(966)-N(2))-methyltransferase RsmD n=1 Tax=Autumnicola tepida TaxID=3075595 RepID=A0ABU3CDF7_9FLAO|nr:16S rRNA (guanine(966)-N(2))-methyltransferase RsmD [Zunongwangia sp. F363]MDT0644372.1 16S rRNA (guanine(966)-N(2))-methyltransferase RsmD [Zunongwangia sp. F363]
MRIISGSNKGRRIMAPQKLPVRPTTDMAKEALFNILRNQFHLSNIDVLDLFAGTGNISYEFASRGTETITAVDANYECVKFIKKTAAELEFPIQVIKSDVFKYLEKAPVKADVIFADPPYDLDTETFEKIANTIFENKILNPEGSLIIEHSKHTDLSSVKNFQEARKYGSSVFSFFS